MHKMVDFREMRAKPRDHVDEDIISSAYEAHKIIELMYRNGQTEMFKDERFAQFILYQVFCEKFGINSPEKAGHVVLEFPAQYLQPFKPVGAPGKPRALDFAINPQQMLRLDEKIPICIEMKLGANCYLPYKMHAIQSDLIRLSFLRQRAIFQGPSAEKCVFIMFGLSEELDSLYLPGFSKDDQERDEYDGVPSCWSLSVTKEFHTDTVKSVFLDPTRAGKKTGFDIVDEVCIKLMADTTTDFFSTDFALKEPSKAFKTGVKIWTVCMPDPSNGYIVD